MNKKQIYNIWAPSTSKWSNQVKPIAFTTLDSNQKIYEIINYNIPKINYLDKYLENTIIIIDTKADNAIKEAIALANIGYRPIPLFNGTNAPLNATATCNNYLIAPYLIWGAKQLTKIKIKKDANPVFILDINRLNRKKINKTIFDNSWDIYDQDLPSYKYLLNNKINKIIIKSDYIAKDLKKILYNYQKNNIQILYTNGYEEIKPIKLKKERTSNND